VDQVLPVAAQVSDHYLCARGELSSPGCAIHPGERQEQNSSPAQRFPRVAPSRRSGAEVMRVAIVGW
jgi:hypothetical protein